MRVAVIGGGFGGLAVCDQLSGQKNISVDLIDSKNHHLFQPLLYQVAMSGLNPGDIAIPLRRLYSRVPNINVIMAKVEELDLPHSKIYFAGDWHQYDALVFACGSKHHYFGHDQWETHAPGLKTIPQATEIRRRILSAFETAEVLSDPEAQKAYLTFVIVGGGPTGVELAGAIAEMTRFTINKDYKKIDLTKTKVILVEAQDRLLSAFPNELSDYTKKQLQSLGVEVRLNSRVMAVNEDSVQVDQETIKSQNCIWAAGVKPASIAEKLPTPKSKDGRILVEGDCSLKNYPKTFVIGDMAAFVDGENHYLPGLAPVAIQQGQSVGQNLIRDFKGQSRKEFRYFDKGIMATIGRSKAVAKSGKIQLTGFIAWLGWLLIHVLYIARFRNRVFVMLQWLWSYFRFGYGARLITNREWQFYQKASNSLSEPLKQTTSEKKP